MWFLFFFCVLNLKNFFWYFYKLIFILRGVNLYLYGYERKKWVLVVNFVILYVGYKFMSCKGVLLNFLVKF